ncbi:MAG: phosphatase PAP2 family protein [Candidatus Woesearchaeota archaeon]
MRYRKELSVLTLAAVLLFISFLLDAYVLQLFSWIQNDLLVKIIETATSIWLVGLLSLLFSAIFFRKHKQAISWMWLSIFLTALLVINLKYGFARERPQEVGYFLVQYSFPSLHAALAFTVVPFLDRILEKRKLWLSLAGLVALSRIYISAHYLSDVVAGGMIGYAIAIFLHRKIKG